MGAGENGRGWTDVTSWPDQPAACGPLGGWGCPQHWWSPSLCPSHAMTRRRDLEFLMFRCGLCSSSLFPLDRDGAGQTPGSLCHPASSTLVNPLLSLRRLCPPHWVMPAGSEPRTPHCLPGLGVLPGSPPSLFPLGEDHVPGGGWPPLPHLLSAPLPCAREGLGSGRSCSVLPILWT